MFFIISDKTESFQNEVNEIIKYWEDEYGISIPRGNGFGSEAYSLQGISFDETIFWEEKQYIPQ